MQAIELSDAESSRESSTRGSRAASSTIEVLSSKCQNLILSNQVSIGILQVTDPNDAGSRQDLGTGERTSVLRSIDGLLTSLKI